MASCASKISVATELNTAPNVSQFVFELSSSGGLCPAPLVVLVDVCVVLAIQYGLDELDEYFTTSFLVAFEV